MLTKSDISAPKTNVSRASPLKVFGQTQEPPLPSDKTPNRDNLEANPQQRLMICDAMIDLAAAYFNVSSRELRQAGRCVQSISRVRQVAMYVSHTGLGLTMTDVGKGFCRDRTTVMHACHQIEDLRDDEDLDAIVEQFNHVAVAAFSNIFGGAEHG